MARHSDQEQLRAEEAELLRLLDELPEENVIDRMGLADRLETVQEQLAETPQSVTEPARARLTFKGEPVMGSEGILADFGAVALQKFEQMVATVGAYLRTGELGTAGPLPAREEHRLMITGTAVGSFGFELEERAEPYQQDLGFEKSSAHEAIDRVVRVMEGALDSEDALAEEVSDLDFRSVRSLHEFLEAIANRGACFRMEAEGRQVSFPDAHRVRETAEWLREDNVLEEEVYLNGTLDGYLPHGRSFELQEDELGLIRGKIAPTVESPDELVKFMKQRVSIRVHKRALGGGKPRFVLLELPRSVDPAS